LGFRQCWRLGLRILIRSEMRGAETQVSRSNTLDPGRGAVLDSKIKRIKSSQPSNPKLIISIPIETKGGGKCRMWTLFCLDPNGRAEAQFSSSQIDN